MSKAPLDLVFLWHMHQPDYRHRDPGNGDPGDFRLPWTYLHAMKDYTDMAAHLERHPGMRCVVNFVPVLLEQIEDYVRQFESGDYRDPLLRTLAREDFDTLSVADRHSLIETCFRSNHTTMLTPFPRYQRLHTIYSQLAGEGPMAFSYLSSAYYSDLVTWYHLAWTGEAERRSNAELAQLMSKGEAYNLTDRRQLLKIIGTMIASIIPRYRALLERGQIEISSTPQTHPLSPLLLDLRCARESEPHAPLPAAAESTGYPGGQLRVQAQISEAIASHRTRFGRAPTGMWPAEGAISEAFVRHLASAGVKWIASGEGVLRNSLNASGITVDHASSHAWERTDAPGLTLFFRDERLSDLVGFDYSKWHGRDAAAHLIGELEAIRAALPEGERRFVGIILDGENAWEHYPYNGYYFFDDLYGMLAEHPGLRPTTFEDLVDSNFPAQVLPRLTAGSWVYGTLSTWIGDNQKNRAWDLLCSAKRSYDLVISSGRLDAQESALAGRQLSVCESSDWFWWFGDYNPADAVSSFDQLYRANLRLLYQLLKLDAPAQLDVPVATGTRASTATSSSMRRAT